MTEIQNEEDFIAHYLRPLSEGFAGAFDLRDDCAEFVPLPGHAVVLETDPIVEDVHFFGTDAPADIAWKALAVNASDIAAKAARPAAYIMSLNLTKQQDPEWFKAFVDGLRVAQDAFGCVLIGGDTDRGSGPLSIGITMLGELPIGSFIQRGTARRGDHIYISGQIGGAALGLALLSGTSLTFDVSNSDRQQAREAYLRPQPRLGLQSALRTCATASMDVSDGLLKDLDRMLRIGQHGATVAWASLPLASGLERIAKSNRSEVLALATAGGDYEILATVASEQSVKFEKLAHQAGIPVTAIGIVTAEPGVQLLDQFGELINPGMMTGYDHFRDN